MLARYFFPAMNYELMYFCFYSILIISKEYITNNAIYYPLLTKLLQVVLFGNYSKRIYIKSK